MTGGFTPRPPRIAFSKPAQHMELGLAPVSLELKKLLGWEVEMCFFLTLIRVHDRLETRMFHDTTNVQIISWNDTTVHTFIICCHRDKPLSITYLRRKLKYSSCLACVVCLMMVWKVWRSRAQMWDWDTAGWERLHLNQESHAFLGIINDLLY